MPSVVFHFLHAAAVETGTETPASKLLVKKWISVLIKRSLILEPVRGTLQLHDIGNQHHINHATHTQLLC